jgi:hypothetical protein
MELSSTPPPSEATADEASSKPPSADQKIMADLAVLRGHLDKCDSFLRPGGAMFRESLPKTDELLETIGFLEACAPRMVELVEAAAQGAVGDLVLMESLQLNDRLAKCLTDIEAVTLLDNDQQQEDFFSSPAAAAAQPSS